MNAGLINRIRCWLFASLLFSLTTSFGYAQVPAGVQGYQVTVDNHWAAGEAGFAPLRVKVALDPPNPQIEDLLFTVSATYKQRRQVPVIISKKIVIEAGSLAGSAELNIPVSSCQNASTAKLLVERGRFDGRLDRSDLLETNIFWDRSNDNIPATLLVGSHSTGMKSVFVCYRDHFSVSGAQAVPQLSVADLKELPSLHNYCEMLTSPQSQQFNGPGAALLQSPKIHGVIPAELPENWLGLTSVDKIMISMKDFKSLCQTNEQQRLNLERWVAVGGQLIVFGLNDGQTAQNSYANASKFWNWFLGPARELSIEKGISDWLVPPAIVINEEKKIPMNSGRNYYYYNNNGNWLSSQEVLEFQDEYSLSKLKKYLQPGEISDSQPFAIARYLSGQVVLVGSDVTTWNLKDWRVLHNQMELVGDSLTVKLGSQNGVQHLSGFKIPGVGDPPVRMFQILISAFLLAAGPIILLLLRRTEKMQLIFILIPALSFCVCAALFLYAIIVDSGLKAGRVQSFTDLNHRTNFSVSHSRSHCFRGTEPGAYRYSDETYAISPLDMATVPFLREDDQESNTLRGGNIRPRTPHEVSTIRCRPADQRLIIQSVEGNENIRITNRLGCVAKAGAVKTNSRVYLLSDLPDGETVELPASELYMVQSKLSDLLEVLSPDVAGVWGARYGRNQSYFGIEAGVVDEIRAGDVSSVLNETETYVVITDEFPLIEDQLEKVDYKLRAHVIRGKW
jgi:hypothetical protein